MDNEKEKEAVSQSQMTPHQRQQRYQL